MIKSFTGFIIRHRVTVIIVMVILSLFFGYQVTRVKLNADFSSYLQQNNPLVEQFNRIGKIFAGKSITMVLVESKDVFSADTLSLLKKLTAAYENVKGVSYVTSLINVLDFKRTGQGLEVGRLLRGGKIPDSPKALKNFRDYVMSNERYVGNLVSKDGKAAIIVLRLSAGASEIKVINKLQRITDKIAPSGDNISFGGMPSLMGAMTTLISENMRILVPIILIIIFLILFVSFRKPGGVLLPLTIVILATVFTMGLITLFGLTIDLITGLMPVILIALGSADGIHFMKRYYEIRKSLEKPNDAIKETMSEMWLPFVITTVTTMVGFSSLVISQFSVIKQFGLVTALGLFFALAVTFTLLPALLSFARNRTPGPGKAAVKNSNPFMERAGELIYKNRILVLIFAMVIIGISVAGIPMIVKDVDWSLCLQKGSKAHKAEMLLRKKFGGSVPIQVLVKGDIDDPVTLKIMRRVARYLNTVPLVSKSRSIADIISEMNYAMNGRYTVPETRDGVANLLFLMEGNSLLEQMVTSDGREALIQGRLATMATRPMVTAVEQINRYLGELPGTFVSFDLRNIPSVKREAFLRIRAQKITDSLQRTLKARNIKIDSSIIEKVVNAAVFRKKMQTGAYSELQGIIAGYLVSDESDIKIVSASGARELAGRIVKKFKKTRGISPEQIASIVKSEIPGTSDEDAAYLSGSLGQLISGAAGNIKVGAAFEGLKKILIPGLEENKDLVRDLKGDLWEMNENLMVINREAYLKISGGAGLAGTREVRIIMNQTGLAPVLNHMEAALAPSQIYSMLLALIVVILLLSLVQRSMVGGLISVIPISLTILVNFAVMGFFGIGLDSFTSMIASIAVGLGIDYAVHFTSRFRMELYSLKDERLALKKTMGTTGVAIIINALTVGLGFTVLLLAGGQHIRRFGGLTALTMFISALFTLTVLPALILVFKPKYFKKAVKIKGDM